MAENNIVYTFPKTEMFDRFKASGTNRQTLRTLLVAALSAEGGLRPVGREAYAVTIASCLRSMNLTPRPGTTQGLARYIKGLQVPKPITAGQINTIIANIYEANGIST